MLVNNYARFAVAVAAFAVLGATGASRTPAMFRGDAAHPASTIRRRPP